MKKNYFNQFLVFFLIALSSGISSVSAQCGLTYSFGSIPASSGIVFTQYNSLSPSVFYELPVLTGGSYGVSSCGNSVPVEFTVYNNAYAGLFYTADSGPFCSGTGSFDNYVPNFTGNLNMQISEYQYCPWSPGFSSVNISVRQNDNIVFTSPATVCSGKTLTLTATPASLGSGSNPAGNFGAFSGANVTGNVFAAPTVTTPTTYTVTYTFGFVSHNQVITVNPLPTLTITPTPSPALACFGSTVNLNASGASTYTWSGGVSNNVPFTASSGNYTVTGTSVEGCTSTAVQSVTVNPAINTSSAVTNVACNGGSNGVASITASGGTGGYTYLWSNGGTTSAITGLMAGVYTATVTDANSCTNVKSAQVTQPTALVTSTAVTNVACNGGSNGVAAITASGGAGSYTYLWSNGGTTSAITGLMAGVYTATVTDANSCTSIKSAQVTQPTAIVTTTAVTNVACNGGSNGVASITASGGAGGYTYLWNNGGTTSAITGLMAGVYTATVTDANSCTSIKSAQVTQPTAIVTATSVVNISCNGASNGVTAVSASGGAGSYTYTWSPTGGNSAVATGLAPGVYTVNVRDANGCTVTRNATITQPTALTATTGFTNTSCNGGANGRASVSVSGGTPSYIYSWAPSGGTGSLATGLSTGTYTCTIEDAYGCQITRTVTVGQPTAISTSTAVTNVSCNAGSNGVASITASGGTGGYTYLWSNGGTTSAITGLMAGVYTATVTDSNSCTNVKSAQVTQPTAIVTTTAVTNVACNGGSNGVASITASGGAGSYTYLWSNGGTTSAITGLMPGVYTATVTDANSCTSIKSAQITQPTAIVTTTAVTNVACNGGSNGVASITASGGAGSYTYLWSNGGTTSAITGLMAGVYTATVTDANSCTSIKSAQITQPTAIVTTTAVTNVACNGGSNGVASITASGGAGSYTYLWSNGGNTSAITGLMAGVYTATVTDANSCTSIKSAQVTQPTAITTSTSVTNVSCNGGSNGVASVTASGGAGSYTYSWTPSGGAGATASGLTQGNYTATIMDANGCVTTASVSITEPTMLTANATASSILCNGGMSSVTVTATGGTTAYSGTGTFTAMAGTQTYTITDFNGCTVTTSVTITEPALLTANATSDAILCNGGMTTVTVTANDGTPAYSGVGTFTAMAGTQTYTVTDLNGCMATASITITEPALLTANATSDAILCNGGMTTVTVTANDGTPSYSGVGTFTAMAGTQTYTVTDANGCMATASITITEPALLTANATSDAILCNGGMTTVTVTANDGTPAYSGVGTFTAMAGTQTYTVTDLNGCMATASITITEPALLTANATSDAILCNGGMTTVTVTANDGTPAYSGVGTFTAMAGTQTYTVTDVNGCMATASVNITEPAAIVSSQTLTLCQGQSVTVGTSIYSAAGTYTDVIAAQNTCDSTITTLVIINSLPNITVNSGAICAGQSFTIVPAGADTYTISGGTDVVTPTADATYSVSGTDVNGCISATDAISTVTVNALPVITATTSNTLLCTGETATLSVTGSVSSYTWSTSETTMDIAVSPTTTTTYTVDGMDANGCQNSTTVTQDVSLCTGIASVNTTEIFINVYPNPNNGSFNIELSSDAKVIITNSLGQVIVNEEMSTGKHEMDIHNQADGVYFVKVIENNKQRTVKFIKK